MKILKGRKGKKITAAALAVLVLFLFVTPHQLSAGGDPCKKALTECLIDAGVSTLLALVAGMFGSPIIGILAALGVGISAASGCFAGYTFCEKYVKMK